MRIWDIPVSKLCDKHLLGEHFELHTIFSIIANDRKGYSRHPETVRWKGKLKALYIRHGQQVVEMTKRGFNHKSPLDIKQARGESKQTQFIHTIKQQKEILKSKGCDCKI